MNKDFRVSVSFPHHPKTKKLIRQLGYEAFYSLINLWSFVAMNKPNGILNNMDIDDIEIAADWQGECSKFVLALIEHKFMNKENNVYAIHDWKDHNGYAFYSPERSDKAKKAAESRWLKKNKNKDLMLNDANSMLQASPSNAPSPNPSPNPSPSPVLKKDNKKKLAKIELPDWISKELWNQFLNHRKSFKPKLTLEAERLNLNKLAKLREQGDDPKEIIEQTIANGWKGFFSLKSNKQKDPNVTTGKYSDLTAKNIEGFKNWKPPC